MMLIALQSPTPVDESYNAFMKEANIGTELLCVLSNIDKFR